MTLYQLDALCEEDDEETVERPDGFGKVTRDGRPYVPQRERAFLEELLAVARPRRR